MKSNNVILFPNTPPDALSKDTVKDQVVKNKKEAIDEVIDSVMPGLLQSLDSFTITLTNDHDIGLVCESLKSAIYRSQGLEHPLQKAAESTIRIID